MNICNNKKERGPKKNRRMIKLFDALETKEKNEEKRRKRNEERKKTKPKGESDNRKKA